MHPPALQAILDHFSPLNEAERRDELISLAEAAERHAPREGVRYEVEEVRKDNECSDTVGIHLRRREDGRLHLAISHGCKVQTLTRALSVVLCRGLEGATPAEVAALEEDFITRIVGEQLVQLRARTIFYVLRRVKAAVEKLAGPA